MTHNKLLCFWILFLLFSICAYAQFDQDNTRPIADAGVDREVKAGEEVELQGSGSDMENAPLTFKWAIVFKPVGSKARLSDTDIHNPAFIADMVGGYLFNLRVNDGQSNSLPDTVLYTAKINLSENNKSIADADTDVEAIESDELCVDKTCNLTLKQWCDKGVFVSVDYCENCGNQDSSCPSCDDGIMNGDESDIDCGRACRNKCLVGQNCNVDEDCEDGIECISNTCSETKPGVGMILDKEEEGDEDDKKEIGTIPLDPVSKSNGIGKTLFIVVIIIIIFGAGSYVFYYYKDYLTKPKKIPNVLDSISKYVQVFRTPEEKRKIEKIVKKRRKAKKEKREKLFETFYKKKKTKKD